MPDGRPLLAWENQLEIQAKALKDREAIVSEAIIFREIAGVIFKAEKELSTLEWHFYIKQIDIITAPDFYLNLEKYLNRVL